MANELETYREQLASNPDDAEALARLEAALLEAGDWPGLVALTAEQAGRLDDEQAEMLWIRLATGLEETAEAIDDAAVRSQIYLIIGQVAEQRLGAAEDAMRYYQGAFQLDSSNLEALEAARAIYVEAENWDMVLQLYKLQADAVAEDHERAGIFLTMADLCDRQLQQPAQVIKWASRALEIDPNHPEADRYRDMVESSGRDRRARYDALLEEVKGIRDPRQRLATMLERAALWSDESPDDPFVEQVFKDVLAKDPRNDTARQLLYEYYETNERWDDLVAYLEERAKATARKSDRLAIYQRLAEIAQHVVADGEQAVRWHREVLKLSPTEQESLEFCVEHYSAVENWADLVKVYEAALRTRHRSGNEQEMLFQIAMIYWRKLEDLKGAENYFKRIKLNNPRDPMMLQFYSEFYADKGDYKRLLGVLGARQNNEETIEAKVAMGLEMAEVAENQLKNREKAIDIWKSLLRLDASNATARDALRRLYFDTKKWNALLEFLKEDFKLVPDDDVEAQVGVYRQMIDIYRDQLGLPVMVINTYNQILQVDPSNGEALDALEEKYRESQRWNDLIGILNRRAETADEAGDEGRFIELYRQIAGLWLDRFSNPNQAIQFLEGILERRPADEQAIKQLIDIYKNRKDWRSLYGIYRRQLDLLEDDERTERLVEMARIADKRLDEKAEAIELWSDVLEADPERQQAWQALEALYQKTERWDELADLYERKVERLEEDKEKTNWLRKLGNVYAEKIGDEERAAETWRKVLRLHPGDLNAEGYLRELYLRRDDWDALEGLYGERADWSGFVRLLNGSLDRTETVEDRVALLKRAARISRVNLEDEAGAVSCWERILDADRDNLDAARTLAPHYTRTEQWESLIRVLEVVLRNDPEDPVDLMVELARVNERHLDAPEVAFDWYSRALRSESERIDLLIQARRMAALSDRYVDLVDLLELVIDLVDDVEIEVRMRRMLAEITGEELGRSEDAVIHFERVRELEGELPDVLESLKGLYERLGRWDDLLEVYQRQLEQADMPAEQSRILTAIGQLHETVRDDPDSAQQAYEELRIVDPDNVEALRGLQRLADRAGDLLALTEHLSAELELSSNPDDVATLLFRLGQLADVQGDPDGAMDNFARVLEVRSEHPQTVHALSIYLDEAELAPRAAEILEPFARSQEDWAGLRRVLLLQVEGSDDFEFNARLLREVAEIEEGKLVEADAAFATYARLLEVDRGDGTVREQIERLADVLQRWEETAELYARFGFDGDLTDGDTLTATLYSRRLARVQEERLERFEDARSTLETVMTEQGESLELLGAVDRLATKVEDWSGLIEICERKLGLLDEVDDRVAMLFRIGGLWEERLEDADSAVETYRRVLAEVPGQAEAVAALERIFYKVERFRDLADLLEDRLADAEEDAQRVALGFQLAQVLEHQLESPADALERYADVLDIDAGHDATREALESLLATQTDDDHDARLLRARACDILEPIYAARDDWQNSIKLLQIRLGDADVPPERVELHVRIAGILEEAAKDAPAAFVSYGEAFGEEYGNPDVLEQLLRLAESLDAWTDLAGVLRRGLDDPDAAMMLDPVLKRDMLGRVAALYEERIDDRMEAIAFNRRILDDDPEDTDALESLDRLYLRVDDVHGLAEIIARRVELTLEPADQAALCFRLGELYELRLEDTAQAIEAYARVREDIDPDDLRAHTALERLHTSAGNWDALVEVQLDHAEHLEDEAARIDLLFSAAGVYETALDNPDEAVVVLRQVLELDESNRRALAELDRLYVQTEQPLELQEILERELELAADDAERNGFAFRMGELQRDHIGDLERAVECFQAVLGRTPDHADARAALEGLLQEPEVLLAAARILVPLYEKDAAWQSLRDTLRLTLEELDGPEEQVETLKRIALIEEEHLDAAAEAFGSLAEAYRLSEAEVELEQELERLAGQLGDHAALADLLTEVVDLAPHRAVDIHLKIAIVSATHLDDAPRAIGEYRNVLEIEPDNAQALDALETLYALTEAHEDLVEVLERKAELAEELADRKVLLQRIASIQEDVLGDSEAGIETWRRLMAEDEREETALDNLERLYRLTERWIDLSSLYEHRMSIVDEPTTLAEFEYRLGRVSEVHLGDGQRALELYRQVLSRVPSHPETRSALANLFADEDAAGNAGVDRIWVAEILEPLYRADENFAALVPVLEARQEGAEGDPEEQTGILREIASLQESKLDDKAAAFGTCGRVVRLMPEHDDNRADLRRLAEAIDRFDDLAFLLEEVAADTPDPELRVGLLLELGMILERHCNRDEQARDVYREVLGIDPENKPATNALVELFTRTHSWELLVELWNELAENALDPEEQKAFYFKVCQLLEEVIVDVDRAIETYRQVLAIEPDNQRAFKELERFFREEQRWPELADILRDQIQYATEDGARAELRHQLGDVLFDRLDDPEEAVESWRTVVTEDAPSHEGALAALEKVLTGLKDEPDEPLRQQVAIILEPLYEGRERWKDWVGVLEVQLHFQDDAWSQLETLRRIAEAHEAKLDDAASAFQAFGRAFAVDYGNPDLQRELDRLGNQLQAWDALVAVYEDGVDDFADMEAAVGILLKVANIHDEQLSSADRAIDSYRKVLAIDESNAQALDALERILAAEKRYRDLVEVLERKAEYSNDLVERKELLFRVCDLWDEMLEQPEEAIATYRRVFEDDPEDLTAIEALIGLYARTEQWDLLIEMLREKLEQAETDDDRKPILYRIAETYEVRLDDSEETIMSFRSVLDLDPRDRKALDALDRLYSREGRWNDLIDLLEGERDEYLDEDPARVDALELRIGDVLEHQIGQIPEAIERYGEVLQRSAESVEARAALERLLDDPDHRLMASRVLEPHYEERDEPDALARVYELQLLDIMEPYDRIELLKRLARLHNEVLKNPRSAFDSYARAFNEDPSDQSNYEELDALADELGTHEQLAALFQAQVDGMMDGEVAFVLHRRLARLYDDKLEEHKMAVASWQAVLNTDPYDDEALRALDRLYQKDQQWQTLIEVLRRRIEVGAEEDELHDLRFRLGYLLEVVEGDVASAIDLYRTILWEKGDHEFSLEAMERLAVHIEHREGIAEVLDPIYREAEQWEKLAILTEMRIELTDDRHDRAQLWAQVADLRETRLNDGATALKALLQAFEELPEDEEIRERLIRIATERGAWAQMADAFESAQTRLDDPDIQLEDHLRVADWCRGRLQDKGRAVDHYRQALEIDETNERALDALEELYTEAESWEDLAEVFRRKAAAVFDLDDKKARLHQLGKLCAEKLGDRAAAVEAYHEILDIDDGDGDALSALEALHAEAEDWESLYDVLARRADTVYDGAQLAVIHRRMGELSRDKLEDPARAAEGFEKVLDFEPEDAASIAALRALYTGMEQWHDLQEVLIKQLSIVEAEDARVDVLTALGDNAEHHLDRADNAIEYYRQILSLRPADDEAFGRLTRLYESSERWYDLVEALRDRVGSMRDAGADQEAIVSLLVQIATVADAHLGDADLAIETLNEVLDAQPNHAGALTVLARLYERSGEWEKAATTLEQALQHATGDDLAVAWRRIGLLYLDELDQPEKALAALENAVSTNGDDEALEALIRIARADGDDARVAELLEQRLTGAEGAARAALLTEIAGLRTAAGNHDGAVAALEEAYGLAPDDLKVADSLLEGLFAAGRHSDAEPVLLSIIEQLTQARRYKDLFTYNYRMGCVAEERGDEETALRYFTQCFEYDATYVPNLVKLGELHFRRQDWNQALKIFQTVLLHQMKLDKPGRIGVFYHLGQTRLALGDERKAKDMFRRALSLDPDHAPSKQAFEQL